MDTPKDIQNAAHAILLQLRIFRALSKVSDLESALRKIFAIIRKSFPADSCSLLIFDSRTKRPRIKSYSEKVEGSIRYYIYGRKQDISGFEGEVARVVARERRPILIQDISKEKTFSFPGSLKKGGKKALFSVPILLKGEALGVINIMKTEPAFIDKETEELMIAISKGMAEALQSVMEKEALIKEQDRLRGAINEKEKDLEEIRSMLAKVQDQLEEKEKSLYLLGKQLIDMRQFSESVLQSLSSGLISVDKEGRITYMNREAEKILQCNLKEVVSRPLEDVFTGKGGDLDVTLEGQGPEDFPYGRETILLTRDGKEIPIGYSISSHLDAMGNELGKIVHFRDLTDKKRMQEEIIRMDRLVALGQISMGIAHEIRNPLAGIRITAQAMEEELPEGDPKREYLLRIIKEIDRLNELLKSFFSFARPKKPEFSLCYIHEIVKEVRFLIQKDIRDRGIDFIEDYAEGLPPVRVDFNQMKQAFLNLILNSIQAMPRGGLLRIGCFISEDFIDKDKGTRFLEITISDTGKGINEEHLPRIFDPFFTTKAKGLGLGLSITYRIIKRHNGQITVKSKKGEGTIFYIKLPIQSD